MEWKLNDDRPIWLQLAEQMTRRIITGVYPPGSKLPPVRELAAEAGVNPDTAMLDAVRRAEAHVVVNQYYHAMAELGYSQQEATAMLKEEEQ